MYRAPKKKVISFIGTGKIGQSLGRMMSQSNIAKIGGIFNHNNQTTKTALKFIGAGIPCNSLQEIPRSDMVFITTPDREIEKVCKAFVAENKKQDDFSMLHCSGSLTDLVLASAKSKMGAMTGSIHPIQSFGNKELAIANFSNTICSFQGDKELFPQIQALFSALGAAKVFALNVKDKTAYHLSGMFPGCLTVALMKISKKLYVEAGVPEDIADSIIQSLLKNTALRLEKDGINGKNFDGPIARADYSTLEKHLDTLANSEYQALYRQLMRELAQDINDIKALNYLDSNIPKASEF